MKISPCLHPKYITCKDGVKRSVPCGKCSACVVNKGMRKANRIKDYIVGYKFQFLITLTFEDKYLPLARYSSEDFALYHDIDCDYDGVVYSFPLAKMLTKDKDILHDTLKKFGGVPVLSHRALILFKKRLRYHLNKLGYDKELFLYGCGEYGPTTFRPHYHLIFGSKSYIPTIVFEKCVRSAWSFCTKTRQGNIYTPFGFVDVERSFGKKSIDYLAKYLSCTAHIPSYLADAQWRPFSCGSSRCSEHLFRISQNSLAEVFYNPTNEVRILRSGKYTIESVPDCYKSRFFPLISKFSKFSNYELYSIYNLYNKYPESSSCYESFLDDFLKQVPWDSVLEYNQPFTGRNESILPLSMLQMAVEDICFKLSDGTYIYDKVIQKRNFMRLYYVSRKVCLNAKELDISVSTYVDNIIKYYNSIELDRLKKFYDYQNELIDDIINPVSVDDLFTLYYHTDSSQCDIDYYSSLFGWHGSKFEDIPQQKKYSELCDGILKDTTKTKKRNDKFNSLGLIHTPYVSRISKQISKFLTF